jgi:hypothetical protein
MPDRATTLIPNGRPPGAGAMAPDWHNVLTASLAAAALAFLSAVVCGLL